MKIVYDPNHNVAYIAFREKAKQVESITLSEDLNIDISADGTLYGIELLNAIEQLAGGVDGVLKIVNESSGRSVEVPLNP